MKNLSFIRTIVLCSFILATVQFQSKAEETDIFWKLEPAVGNCNLNYQLSIQSSTTYVEFKNWVEAIIRGIWADGGVNVNIGPNNTFHLNIMMAGKMDACEYGLGTCNPFSVKDCVVPNHEITQMLNALGLSPGGGSGGGGCGGGDGGSAHDPVTPC